MLSCWTGSPVIIISLLFSFCLGPARDGACLRSAQRGGSGVGQTCGGLLPAYSSTLPSSLASNSPSLYQPKVILCVCLGSSLQKESRKMNTQLTRGLL